MHRIDSGGPAAALSPTARLMTEHRVIEQVLGCLAKIADGAMSGKLVEADARDAVRFLQEFADRCHHGKEEAQLFPMLERFGMPSHVGPTAVMRAEHDEGRAHVRAMSAALDAADPRKFAREAGAFVGLLEEHIMKEDQVLFPMADGMIDAAAQSELGDRFDRVETDEIGAALIDECLAIADRLGAAYGVPRPLASRPMGGCMGGCGGH